MKHFCFSDQTITMRIFSFLKFNIRTSETIFVLRTVVHEFVSPIKLNHCNEYSVSCNSRRMCRFHTYSKCFATARIFGFVFRVKLREYENQNYTALTELRRTWENIRFDTRL